MRIQLYKYITFLLLAIAFSSCSELPEEEGAVEEKAPQLKKQRSPSINPLPEVSSEQIPFDNIHCGIEASDGSLWFGSTGHGVYRFQNGAFDHYTELDGLTSNNVSEVMEDSDGNILFASAKGLCVYNGLVFKTFTTEQELHEKSITSLYEDRSGVLWVATFQNGAYIREKDEFKKALSGDLERPEYIKTNTINEFYESPDGSMWMASWALGCEGITRIKDKQLLTYRQAEGVEDTLIHCIEPDLNGNIWFGSRDHGVYKFDGSTFSNITADMELANACIYDILCDSKGRLWFTTEKDGVWMYDGQRYTSFSVEDGLPHNSVFCALEDSEGNIWFGTRNVGLCRFDGENFEKF